MTDVIDAVAKHLKIKEISVDNAVFKLFTKGSVILCLTGAVLCAATQYFGAPITCAFDSHVPSDLAERYCWIHGSNWIDEKYQQAFDCIVTQQKDDDATTVPTTSYYQWVIFFLLLQAALFALPYKLWKAAERGVVKGFVTDEARSVFVLCDDDKFNALLDTYVAQFNSILHRNSKYFVSFVFCEMLNIIILYVNFFSADAFLNYKFRTYGFKVYEYYTSDAGLAKPNPMCDVFPTKVSCDLKIVAETGSVNEKNGFCILSQNIVNEKVFLVLFYWYMLLFIVSALYMLYRLLTIALPAARTYSIVSKIGEERSSSLVRSVLNRCNIGDWFILNQIAKNVNPYFFREFLEVLENEIGKKPVRNRRNQRSTTTSNPGGKTNGGEKVGLIQNEEGTENVELKGISQTPDV